MRVAVPALVSCGVVEPEIGAEIDERNARIEDRGGDPLAMSMRQRGKNEVDVVESAVVELLDRASA